MSAAYRVVLGTAEEALLTLEPGSVGAVITDPPSGIGFMGAAWDHHKGGRTQWVAWLASVLTSARAATKPGGRALVWSLPRTSHWTGAAVEDAGWAIESHVAHLFGQGWPKAKTQLKPAHELWWLARTGPSEPLGIDTCRVGIGAGGSREGEASAERGYRTNGGTDFGGRPGPRGGDAAGRWPPTVVTSHTPWCRRATCDSVDAWECAEGCPVATVGDASGKLTSNPMGAGTLRKNLRSFSGGFSPSHATKAAIPGDTGTAARFFPQFPAADPQEPCPIVYAGKVPPSERWVSAVCGCGVRVQLLSDAEPTAERRDEGLFCTRCNLARVHHVHPTQKSVALMRWFVRLVSSHGDIILDPFAGSGTTGVAAVLEGRRFLGIEMDPHHHTVACARIDAAATQCRSRNGSDGPLFAARYA